MLFQRQSLPLTRHAFWFLRIGIVLSLFYLGLKTTALLVPGTLLPSFYLQLSSLMGLVPLSFKRREDVWKNVYQIYRENKLFPSDSDNVAGIDKIDQPWNKLMNKKKQNVVVQ